MYRLGEAPAAAISSARARRQVSRSGRSAKYHCGLPGEMWTSLGRGRRPGPEGEDEDDEDDGGDGSCAWNMGRRDRGALPW